MTLYGFEADQLRTVPHWIAGRIVSDTAGAGIEIINPRVNKVIGCTSSGTVDHIQQAVDAADVAQEQWSSLSALERSEKLARLAQVLLEYAEQLGRWEAEETGKPVEGAIQEIRDAAQYFSYYGGMVPALLGDTIDMGAEYHAYTVREPYGVVGIITPWNVPLNQAARAAAPALAAGNTVVIKPSEFTPTTSFQLGVLSKEAGIPDGVINIVQGAGPIVGEALLRHRRIAKVAFTGSVRTGQAISAIAAERILPLSLELGGKSANIIFSDADLVKAARISAGAFLGNSGQACSAGTRILVERKIQDEFVELLKSAMQEFVNQRDMGPLTTRAQFEKVEEILKQTERDGVEKIQIVLEGKEANGLFVNPTIFTGVDNSMQIARDEVFGPVGVVIPFTDEAEAVAIANDSEYGLAGAVWTQDMNRAHRIARRIESGQVYINTYLGPTIELPFGGHKMSGYGREKGFEALLHYTHTKAIAIELQGTSLGND